MTPGQAARELRGLLLPGHERSYRRFLERRGAAEDGRRGRLARLTAISPDGAGISHEAMTLTVDGPGGTAVIAALPGSRWRVALAGAGEEAMAAIRAAVAGPAAGEEGGQ